MHRAKGKWPVRHRSSGEKQGRPGDVSGIARHEEARDISMLPGAQNRQHTEETILRFSVPALGTVLADPIMGFVDVLCLGQASSTTDLAAMGPNLTVFNFVTYVFLFLGTVTTIKISKALSHGDMETAERYLSAALLVAVWCGSAIMAGILMWPRETIEATGALPALVAPAARYARVRALAVPATLATMVLHSGLLAQKDIKTPVIAIGLSVLCNVLGDILLVNVFGLGLLGTAIATAISVWISVAVLVKLGYSKRGSVCIRYVMPSGKIWKTLAETAFWLLLGNVGNTVTFALIQASSTRLNMASCAAHQALYSFWTLCAMSCYPFQQTTQVFLTEELEIRGIGAGANYLMWLLLKVSGVAGLVLGAMCSGVTALAPGLLVRDPQLWPVMICVSPFLWGSMIWLGLAYPLEAAMMVLHDSGALSIGRAMLLLLVVVTFRLESGPNSGIRFLWALICVLYFLRCSACFARLRARGLLSHSPLQS